MTYTADTYFFLQLKEKNPKALQLWHEIKTGKGQLVVPTIVFTELTRIMLREGDSKPLKEFLAGTIASEKVLQCWLTTEFARKAGEVSYQYSMPTVDSIILATALLTEHTNVITADAHFNRPAKERIIRKIEF